MYFIACTFFKNIHFYWIFQVSFLFLSISLNVCDFVVIVGNKSLFFQQGIGSYFIFKTLEGINSIKFSSKLNLIRRLAHMQIERLHRTKKNPSFDIVKQMRFFIIPKRYIYICLFASLCL